MKKVFMIMLGLLMSISCVQTLNAEEYDMVKDGVGYKIYIEFEDPLTYEEYADPIVIAEAYYTEEAIVIGDDGLGELTIKSEVDYYGNYFNVKYVHGMNDSELLRSVIIEPGVRTLDGFSDCKNLERVDLPNTVREIKGGSFNDLPSLKSITLPESLEKVGDMCFTYCGLVEVKINCSAFFCHAVFKHLNDLETIIFDDKVSLALNEDCFGGFEKLRTLRLSKNQGGIGLGCFGSMPNLEELCLSEREDMEIDAFAFTSLPKLKRIYCPMSTPPQVYTYYPGLGNWHFYEFSSYPRDSAPIDKAMCKLLVPPGCVDAYRNSRSWGCFANIEEYQFDGVDDVTVDGGDVADNPDAPCYDLYGRLVVDPAPGLYIRNGKKIVVR